MVSTDVLNYLLLEHQILVAINFTVHFCYDQLIDDSLRSSWKIL